MAEWAMGSVNKVFNYKLEDGQAPVGDPILDYKGNKNEEKLKQKSDANKTKKPGVVISEPVSSFQNTSYRNLLFKSIFFSS
jgi:hypothetical protein